MHSQGNYTNPARQDPYVRRPAFQKHPTAPGTLVTSHYNTHTQQSQVYQQGHPSFRLTPGLPAYQHGPPTVLHQGPHAPVASSGLSSAVSYIPHPQAPHINTEISHSYPNSELQYSPWSQNVHQLPPTASLTGPSAYRLPSSQGHTLGRGPSHQPMSHAPPSSLTPHSSNSSALVAGPFGSSVLPMREHSHLQPVLPPPPPSLPSSPPHIPPIPPSSLPDIVSKRGGGGSLKALFNRNNSVGPYPVNPAQDRSAHETCIPVQHSENSGIEVGPTDAVVAHSPSDSDMEMEDDITHPDEEKKTTSINSNDEYVSKFQDDYAKEQLQSLQHAGGHRLPEDTAHGYSVFAEASVSKGERGSEIVSDCNTPDTMKASETDDSGMSENRQTERPLDFSIDDSFSQQKTISQPIAPVLHSETGNVKLSDQAMEDANPVKLLQGYASNNTSENDEENLKNVGLRSTIDGSTDAYVEKGCGLGSELRHETLTERDNNHRSKSMVKSPRNVTQAGKLSVPTQIAEEVSDRSHGGQEPVRSRAVASQMKDSSYYDSTNLEGANLHKLDMKSKSSKLNVDEFGRLVREGVSDSDTSDSPHYARRHARRTRKRSRSRNRSRSPYDRRRRRSPPWRRKERRSRSRSLSPKRRSRSRSPVLRRDSEFGGDKLRQERGQILECFDFLRGKCYRGANCRYSHHESDKSGRSRYNRDKYHYRDAPHNLQSPDFPVESSLPAKEMRDKGLRLPQDTPGSREAKDVKKPSGDSSTGSPTRLGSWGSGCTARDSGKDKSLFRESTVRHSDEIPQTVYQQGKRADNVLASGSSAHAKLIGASSTHHPVDKPDAIHDPTTQPGYVVPPVTKPYSTEEVPSQSLKELLPSIANHPSSMTLSFPSASQAVSASFAQQITQDYSSMPPTSQNHIVPENSSPYQAPVTHQHSHIPGPSNFLSSSFVPLPPPPPPPAGEHSFSSQHIHPSVLPPWNGLPSSTFMRARPTELSYRSQTGQYQGRPLTQEPDKMLHIGSNTSYVSNLINRQGGSNILGEDRLSGHPVQVMNHSLAQSQTNSSLMQSSLMGTHISVAGLPSDSISHHRPYYQQPSCGLQYSGDIVPEQHAGPGIVGSSASRITPDFLERNHPSYVHDIVETRTSNYFNPYASTFDLPRSSKLSSNALVQENDKAINTKYGAPVGSSTTPVDMHKTGSVGSRYACVLPRENGDQYDPIFDSIEPASNSFTKADHQKHETTGDSDDVLRFSGSGRVLSLEVIKHEGGSAASANDSLENEEFGETAGVAVGAVLNGTPSDPNDAIDTNAGEIEIDQVHTSGKKKKKSKERSMKLFKSSVATFVKEVLKPSWRQGNMSKEAFKTIVKKTVDKVSGAMKSHQIPKSQEKINHYIDSSRGKLTKLVMGYVDKYVKV